MVKKTYILTAAPSGREAMENVSSWLRPLTGSEEFYPFEHGKTLLGLTVPLLSSVRASLAAKLDETRGTLPRRLGDLSSLVLGHHMTKNTLMECKAGHVAKEIMWIMLQRPSPVMPFYNMDSENWWLPLHDDDDAYETSCRYSDDDGGVRWYAVPVELSW